MGDLCVRKGSDVKVAKRVIADLDMVYAVCPIRFGGKLHFLAATESHGRCLLFSPPEWRVSVVWEEPGGTMSLCPVPGTDAVLAIQDFFPVFKSEKASIVWAEPNEDPSRPWNVCKAIDLPFVHRTEVVPSNGGLYLVAASLCGSKAFTDDWSSPGTVYVGRLPEDPQSHWRIEPVLTGITKNHGIHVASLNGRQVVLVAGQEGLFEVRVPQESDQRWSVNRLLSNGVSDAYVADIDCDGEAEIVTIEPFHGDRLAVYKHLKGRWQAVAEKSINFGHALWAGSLRGRPAIVVGNRGGDKALVMFTPSQNASLELKPEVLDEGVGSAQVAVASEGNLCVILSANHASSQVVLYEIT